MLYQIAIVGAGIGGLCAALALSQQGHSVTVYEQASLLSEMGAGLQLSPNAMRVLDTLGLNQPLLAAGFLPKKAVMRHYQSGDEYFAVTLGQQAVKRYGAQYIHIHRADLQHILLTACHQQKIRIHLGHCLQSYQSTPEGVTLKFANGQSAYAQLLVGADGIKSQVQRQRLNHSPPRFTGQVAWRGLVAAHLLPKGLIKPNANLWVGPNQHFVSYYLRGGRYINFVAVEEHTHWQQESWQHEGNILALREKFSGWHPEVTHILEQAQQTFLWALFDRAPLNRWVDERERVVLLGDACHPMLPFLAQGAAMAIEDGWALAKELTKAQPLAEALQNYELTRKPRTRMIQQKARSNAHLYHMSSITDRAKLAVMHGLAKVKLSNSIATNMLDEIYNYPL